MPTASGMQKSTASTIQSVCCKDAMKGLLPQPSGPCAEQVPVAVIPSPHGSESRAEATRCIFYWEGDFSFMLKSFCLHSLVPLEVEIFLSS